MSLYRPLVLFAGQYRQFQLGDELNIPGSLSVGSHNGAGLYRVAIGASGGSYGSVGYGFAFTDTSNTYTYAVDDTASMIRFENGGFQFKTAPSGTTGGTITFTDRIIVLQNGNTGIGGTPDYPLDVFGNAEVNKGANGQGLLFSSVTELVTIAAAASTTSTIVMPTQAVILAVSASVIATSPGVTFFNVYGATNNHLFSTHSILNAADATGRDGGQSTCPYFCDFQEAIKIVPNATPSNNSGRMRITIHYYTGIPPTS